MGPRATNSGADFFAFRNLRVKIDFGGIDGSGLPAQLPARV
jgi:hypothetical protein